MIDSLIKIGSAHGHLGASPINSSWILEGNPVARNKLLSRSADGSASTYIWDCSAGRFNWHYDIDETVYIIEGSVILRDGQGAERAVSAGDTVFFPAGSTAEWTVQSYVRKVAFLRAPIPKAVFFAKQVYRVLKRMVKGARGGEGNVAPAMFQSN
jgi:uncharacterized cupin superfamily protein